MKKIWKKPIVMKIDIIEITKSGTSGNTENHTWQGNKRQVS